MNAARSAINVNDVLTCRASRGFIMSGLILSSLVMPSLIVPRLILPCLILSSLVLPTLLCVTISILIPFAVSVPVSLIRVLARHALGSLRSRWSRRCRGGRAAPGNE